MAGLGKETPPITHLEGLPLEIMAKIVLILEPKDASSLRKAYRKAEVVRGPFMDSVWRHRDTINDFYHEINIERVPQSCDRKRYVLMVTTNPDMTVLGAHGKEVPTLPKLLYISSCLSDFELRKSWHLLETLFYCKVPDMLCHTASVWGSRLAPRS